MDQHCDEFCWTLCSLLDLVVPKFRFVSFDCCISSYFDIWYQFYCYIPLHGQVVLVLSNKSYTISQNCLWSKWKCEGEKQQLQHESLLMIFITKCQKYIYLWIFLWLRYAFWVPNTFSQNVQLYVNVFGKCIDSMCLFMSLNWDEWLEQMLQLNEDDPFFIANCSKSSGFVIAPKNTQLFQYLWIHFFLWTRYALLLPSCLLQNGQA